MIKFNNTCDQEGDFNPRNLSNNNPTSRGSWGFKNPRIVRVSRDYGGKDRHSKVWTVKGLKDRRIRLSIPTAIQLYQLQDQLGLSQPSKVIDWLLDVTKEDIDKLPPLQMAVEDFNRFHLPSSFVLQDFNSTQLSFSPFANPQNYDQRTKGKQVENKWCSYNYNEIQPSYNLSLSRFGDQLDTYNASLLPSSLTSQSEPQFSSLSGNASPSFGPPYFMHNHFQLSTSNSPNMSVPLQLNDTRAKVLFGLHMNCMASSESNDIGL